MGDHYDELRDAHEAPVDAVERVRRLLMQGADVRAVHEVVACSGGDFGFVVETPFALYPRFVVGVTDCENLNPKVLMMCSLQVSATMEFADRWGDELARAAAREALGEV